MTTTIYCDAMYEDQCVCVLPKGHDGPHAASNADQWFEWPNDALEPEPPPLGVHVTDALKLEDLLR